MDAHIEMIPDIKEAVEMQVRSNSVGTEYLEAVIETKHLDALKTALARHTGPAYKEPGKRVKYPPTIQQIVDLLGGVRIEQSFYFAEIGGRIIYATIWPWASDPSRVTLKAGVFDMPLKI